MTLTGEQLQAIKQLVNECKGISNHLRQYLIDNDLYDLEDISVGISVVPRYAFAVEAIVIGRTDSKTTGFCMTVKGDVNDEWRFDEKYTSDEYKKLLDPEKYGSGDQKNGNGEKPLPPDGLWLSASDYRNPVDSGV